MTIKVMLRVYSVAALVLLVFIGLGPAKWVSRSRRAAADGRNREVVASNGFRLFTRLVIEEIPLSPVLVLLQHRAPAEVPPAGPRCWRAGSSANVGRAGSKFLQWLSPYLRWYAMLSSPPSCPEWRAR